MLSCLVNDQPLILINTPYSYQTIKKWANKGILKCPICSNSYEFCCGRVVIPYFRHKDKKKCEDIYSEPETIEHLQGKIDLYNWLIKQPNLTDIVLEGWIPKTKQRPDLMFKHNGNLYILEYQCSPISSEYYERHELYQAAGIKDIWICGVKNYFQEFHKGTGNKRTNVLEDECRLYYDSDSKLLFQMITINSYVEFFNTVYPIGRHRMSNSKDYIEGDKNYYCIKSIDASFKKNNYLGNKTVCVCKPLGEVESFVGNQCFTI